MPHPPISLTSERARLAGNYVARRMIASTARRRLLHSSTTAAAYNNRYQQRYGKRTIRSSFVGTTTSPFGFSQPTNRIQFPMPSLVLPSRTTFFSTETPGNEDHDGDRKQPNSQSQNSNTHDDQPCRSTTPTRFEDLDLHPLTLRALRRQGIHKQTEIQEKTHDVILQGHNVLARSRTGTGKTLAFLVPTIERFLAQQQSEETSSFSDTATTTVTTTTSAQQQGIPILVLAPTRELAAQIGMEAEKLLMMHNKQQGTSKLSSQVVYGGSSKKEDIRRFQKRLPTILVATPGRLKDHLATTTLKPPYNPRNDFDLSFGEMDDGKQNHHDGVSARKLQHVPFRSVFQNRNLRTLVLDETDRLLELGFRRDIQDILACLNNDDNSPPSFGSSTKPEQQSRQTLLFSATVTQDIMDVVDLAITGESKNKNYQMVDCVHENDPTTHTNTGTTQSYIVLPPERFWTGSMEFILQLMTTTKKKKHKVIVFFEMTRLAELYSRFLSLRLGHTSGVWELHGKMHQRERTVVTRRFRNAPHGVLLTSDVSARGVDYPDVSHVVQVGAPQNRETYIHRLGRTGRAGREGEGVLILSPHEQGFVDDELVGLGVVTDDSLQKGLLSSQTKNTKQQSSGGRLGNIRKDLQNELGMLKHDLKTGRDHSGMAESLTLAYHSLVSYYFQTRRRPRRRRGKVAGDDPTPLPSEATTVAILNQLVEDFGLPELPPIGFKRAKSMGIEHLAGQLNIRKDWEDQNWDIHSSNGVESERNDHADFDDWFGLSSTPGAGGQNQSPPRQTSHNNNNNNNHNHNNNNHVHRPSVDSNHSTKEKPTKIEKKTKNIPQFDNL